MGIDGFVNKKNNKSSENSCESEICLMHRRGTEEKMNDTDTAIQAPTTRTCWRWKLRSSFNSVLQRTLWRKSTGLRWRKAVEDREKKIHWSRIDSNIGNWRRVLKTKTHQKLAVCNFAKEEAFSGVKSRKKKNWCPIVVKKLVPWGNFQELFCEIKCWNGLPNAFGWQVLHACEHGWGWWYDAKQALNYQVELRLARPILFHWF